MAMTGSGLSGPPGYLRSQSRGLSGALVCAAFFSLGAMTALAVMFPLWPANADGTGSSRTSASADSEESPQEQDRTLTWAFGIGGCLSALLALLASTTTLATVGLVDQTSSQADQRGSSSHSIEIRLRELEKEIQRLESEALGASSARDDRREGERADAERVGDRGSRDLRDRPPEGSVLAQDSLLPRQTTGAQPPSVSRRDDLDTGESSLQDFMDSFSDSAVGPPPRPYEGAGFDRLIQVWEECRKDGRFHHGIISRQLRQSGLDLEVRPGSELELGNAVIAVSSGDGGELYLLPSFNDSPEAVADWFHNQAPNARLARIDQLIRPAVVQRRGSGYELKREGIVA